MEEEGKGVLYDTTQVVPYGAADAPVVVAVPDEWEDV
jgi:hypothetical protein